MATGTLPEWQNMKLSQVDSGTYNRIASKLNKYFGTKAQRLLSKYNDRKLSEIISPSCVVDLSDCLYK